MASSRTVVEKRVRCTGERAEWAGEKHTVHLVACGEWLKQLIQVQGLEMYSAHNVDLEAGRVARSPF